MDAARFCYVCHKELSEEVAFCESCGHFVCPSCLVELSDQEYESAYPVGLCKACRELNREKSRTVYCPRCGAAIRQYRSPLPTVDIIITQPARGGEAVILIRRRNTPKMWALPGGFCEYGESLEEAALREAKEETGLEVDLIGQFHTYSDPSRDPRHHSITTVFLATSVGQPVAGDDAGKARVFSEEEVPKVMAFDHRRILNDYFAYQKSGVRPNPVRT